MADIKTENMTAAEFAALMNDWRLNLMRAGHKQPMELIIKVLEKHLQQDVKTDHEKIIVTNYIRGAKHEKL